MQMGTVASFLGVILMICLGYAINPENRPNGVFVDYASPAPWTFLIWVPIYILVGGFVIYQALPPHIAKERNNEFIFNKLGWLPSVNLLAQVFWYIF